MLSGPFLVKKQRLPSVHALSGILTPCEFDFLIDYHAMLPLCYVVCVCYMTIRCDTNLSLWMKIQGLGHSL